MLYMVCKESGKYVIYDSDNETIKRVSMDDIVRTYESGVHIFGFNSSAYDCVRNGIPFEQEFGKCGISIGFDVVYYGAESIFRSCGVHVNKSIDYLAIVKNAGFMLIRIDIYNNGIVYTIYVSSMHFTLIQSFSVGSEEFGSNRLFYFGYDIAKGVPVIGTSMGVYYLSKDTIDDARRNILIDTDNITLKNMYRKVLLE